MPHEGDPAPEMTTAGGWRTEVGHHRFLLSDPEAVTAEDVQQILALLEAAPSATDLRWGLERFASKLGVSLVVQLDLIQDLPLVERRILARSLMRIDLQESYAAFGRGLFADPSVQGEIVRGFAHIHDARAAGLLSLGTLPRPEEISILSGWAEEEPFLYARVDPAFVVKRHGRGASETLSTTAAAAMRAWGGRSFEEKINEGKVMALTTDLPLDPILRAPALEVRTGCYQEARRRLSEALQPHHKLIAQLEVDYEEKRREDFFRIASHFHIHDFASFAPGEFAIVLAQSLIFDFGVQDLHLFTETFCRQANDGIGRVASVERGFGPGMNVSEMDLRVAMEAFVSGPVSQHASVLPTIRIPLFTGRYRSTEGGEAGLPFVAPTTFDAERRAWAQRMAEAMESALDGTDYYPLQAALAWRLDLNLPIPDALLDSIARHWPDVLTDPWTHLLDERFLPLVRGLGVPARRRVFTAVLGTCAAGTDYSFRVQALKHAQELLSHLPAQDRDRARLSLLQAVTRLIESAGVVGPVQTDQFTDRLIRFVTRHAPRTQDPKYAVRAAYAAFLRLSEKDFAVWTELGLPEFETVGVPAEQVTEAFLWLKGQGPELMRWIARSSYRRLAFATAWPDRTQPWLDHLHRWDTWIDEQIYKVRPHLFPPFAYWDWETGKPEERLASERYERDMKRRLEYLYSFYFGVSPEAAILEMEKMDKIRGALAEGVEQVKDPKALLRFCREEVDALVAFQDGLPAEARRTVMDTILRAKDPGRRFNEIRSLAEALDVPGTEADQLLGLTETLVLRNPDVLSSLRAMGTTVIDGVTADLTMSAPETLSALLRQRLGRILNPSHGALTEAYRRNRDLAEGVAASGPSFPAGTLFHYTSEAAVDPILRQGNICGECLGISSRSDSYPLHFDAVRLMREHEGIPLAHLLKDRRLRYEGSILLVYPHRAQPDAFAALDEHPVESGIPGHVLLFGGLPKTELGALVWLDISEAAEDGSSLDRLKQAVVNGQLYVPIFDRQGRLLFDHDDFVERYLASKPYGSLEAFLGNEEWDRAYDRDQGSDAHLFHLDEHLRKAERYAETYARAYGLSGRDTLLVRAAARLHDVGKLDADDPQAISNVEAAGAWLDKIRRLSREEQRTIKRLIRHDELLGDLVQEARLLPEDAHDGSPYPPPGPARNLLDRFYALFPDPVSQRQLLSLYRADVLAIDDGHSLRKWEVERTLSKLGLIGKTGDE